MALTVYGLKSCDTCKQALGELKKAGVDVVFHDVREDGVTQKQLAAWEKTVGWESMLNKNSTTWRNLPDADKADVGKAKALALMAEHPTLIKRPLIQRGSTEVHVGWTDAVKKAVL